MFSGERNIKSLKVKCSYKENGCGWQGQVAEAEDHISQCVYRMILCPNMCRTTEDRERSVLQKDVQRHLEQDCPRRMHQCPHCKEQGEHYLITGSHKEVCQHIKVSCDNEGCPEKVKRMEVARHRHSCPFETVKCKYEVVGCKTTLRRQEMEKHETGEAATHLLFAMEAVLKQQERLRSLEGQLTRSSSFNEGNFTFKMPSFSYHRTSSSLFFSPSFYSSPGGYKLCIRVVANGDGQGRETHISVYAVVMKGDYDSNLEWPISGKVTVELLNHIYDGGHHAIQFTYPLGKGDVSTQRVVTGDRAKRGYGKTRFISYGELGYNSEKNCQYLKDDSLYFRVSVMTGNAKPWLACSI